MCIGQSLLGVNMDKEIKIIKQENETDCGVACLAMIFKYYNKTIDLGQIRRLAKSNKYGTTMLNMNKAAHFLGFDSYGLKGSFEDLINENIPLPCVAHIITENSYEHYVVISKIEEKIHVVDPIGKTYVLTHNDFKKKWTGNVLIVLPNCSSDNNLNKTPTKVKSLLQGNKNSLVNYFSALKSFKSEWIKIFVISLLATISSIAAIFLLYVLINMIQPGSQTTRILLFAFLLIILYALEFLFNSLRVKWISKISEIISKKLMCKYSDHLIKSDFSVFDEYTSGDLISRLQDADAVREAVSKTIVTVSLDVIMMIIAMIILFVSSSKLFPLALITIVIYSVAIFKFNTPIYKITENLREADAVVTTQLFENIGGIETIKAYQQEEIYSKKGSDKISLLTKSLQKIIWLTSEQFTLSTFISSVSEVLIIAVGIIFINNDLITFSSLYIFYALFSLCLTPVKNLVDLIPIFKKGEVSANRLDRILDIDEEKFNDEICDLGKEISIRFDGVDFVYENGVNVLTDFNLNISFGKKILIKGKNGSGKSTIIKLLLNLYQPTRGKIYFNDISIDKLPISEIRRRISVVSQDCFVFRGTVIENIKMGNPELNEDEIMSIIENTPLHNVIVNMSNGYNTVLTENGDNISGGQRQIICIARALIKNASILILDEATSALDLDISQSIMSYLLDTANQKTIICISHQSVNQKIFDEVYSLL